MCECVCVCVRACVCRGDEGHLVIGCEINDLGSRVWILGDVNKCGKRRNVYILDGTSNFYPVDLPYPIKKLFGKKGVY